MTRRRTGYVVALVVAVVVLVGSVAAAAAWAPHRSAAVERQLSRTLDGDGPGRGMMAGPSGRQGTGTGRMNGMGSAGRNPAAGLITLDQARTKALTWVDAHLAGAVVDQGVPVSGGYRFTATLHGADAAVIVVHQDGTLVAHLVSVPSPTPSS